MEKEIDWVKQEVINIIKDVSPAVSLNEEKNSDCNLRDLGVDSLDNMSIFLAVQEKFKLEDISDEDMDKLTTVNLIAAYVNGRLSKKGLS